MSFDLQPHLTGSVVALRPLVGTDHDALYCAAADPLIWTQHPEPLRWQRSVFDPLFARLLGLGGALVITDQATKTLIGVSSYYDHRPDSADIVIGYTFLARPFWGGRYNAELKLLMLQHAFQYVETVWFHVGEQNKRSQRAMEKIGARLSHEMRRESGGVIATFLHYCINRTSFQAVQARLLSRMTERATETGG
ncbi:MAG: GNAT family N-acetyltransferase [Proteobacteria bacterium]|nr:GNAT family N-acetyltransferase [Pseudomonadota bacterium]